MLGRIALCGLLVALALVMAFDVYPTYAEFRNKRAPLVEEMGEVVRDRVEITAKWRSLTPEVEKQVEDHRRQTFWPSMDHVGREAAVFKAARALLDATFGRNILQRLLQPADAWEFVAAMLGLALMVYASLNFLSTAVLAYLQSGVRQRELQVDEARSNNKARVEETRLTAKATARATPAAATTAGACYTDVELPVHVQHPSAAVLAH